MQRTDTWATAGIQHGIRFLGGIVALHVYERQLDDPALWMMTIFRHEEITAVGFVDAVYPVDTVSRLDARNIILLRAGHDGRQEKQQKQKESHHRILAYSPCGLYPDLRMHEGAGETVKETCQVRSPLVC